MKILHVHNYHAGRGGMEVIYEYTTRLLRSRGDEVIEFSRDSADLKSPLDKIGAMASGVYSLDGGREARALIEKHRPDLAYVHNLYPMLSTAVLDACRAAGVPTVMNIQDYKLTCPMGQHLRDGKICEKCKTGSVAWSAVHACKGGRVTSAAYAVAHGITRMRRAYHHGIDLFVTPSRFTADYLVSAGFDRSRIEIVPNMCDLPDTGPATGPGEYAAYMGRISPEKGISVLIEAARQTGITTRIAGNGSVPGLKESAPANVRFVGPVSREAVPAFYRGAKFLVVPSIWNEVYAIVLLEAMTLGIPVIGSKIGGMQEVFEHEISGIAVPPGDAHALAAAMQRLWNDPALCARMGQAGRARAMEQFSPDIYYRRLKGVFERAILDRRGETPAVVADLKFKLQGGA
jgi:glycosyltransferase involved in cell wall biosynthesis